MNMKKIFMAALAAMTLLAGCAKENTPVAKQDIKVNFTVAEKGGFGADTKAIKADWALNDEILIVFEGNTGWLNFSNANNTLKLIKGEDGWTVNKTNAPDIANLVSGKKFYAVHHPGTVTLGTMTDAGTYYTATPSNYQVGREYMTYEGTYSIAEGEISGTIALQRPNRMYQISIENLCNEPNVYDWEMALYNEEGQLIYDTCYKSFYLYCYAPKGNMTTIGQDLWLSSHHINLDGDGVFCFNGNNTTAIVKYIGINFGSSKYYYEITPKDISEFFGKAWVLPAINMNSDKTLKPESKWKTTI